MSPLPSGGSSVFGVSEFPPVSGGGGGRQDWCTEVFHGFAFVLASTPPDEPIRGKQPVAGFLNFFKHFNF